MQKINVSVVLQTHSKGDSQHYLSITENKRYCNASKGEVQRRCTRSLVESMNYAKELFLNSNFELVSTGIPRIQSLINQFAATDVFLVNTN